MEDIVESGGHSQGSLPVLSADDGQNCDCGAVVQAQTNLLRQRLMSSMAYELSQYDQFMNSFLSNRQVAHDDGGIDAYQREIDHMLSEMLRISANVLVSVINNR